MQRIVKRVAAAAVALVIFAFCFMAGVLIVAALNARWG